MSDTTPGCQYTKEKSRRGYSSTPSLDPHDGGKWTVLIPHRKMDWVQSRGMGAFSELAYTVRWALLNPCRLFRGVRDDEEDIDDDGWLCYVSRPNHAYNWKTHQKVAPWPDEVFLVYVTDERVVYSWLWVERDPNDANLPINFEDRFKVKVF